jgi:hypothetical protein
MHLSLIDGPLVLHNLISTQESHVPLPKFQMAARPKILMFSGSKKGTQIYFFFSLKSPSKQTPSRLPSWAPMEREAQLQGILRISQKPYLSGSPIKKPSLKLPFIESLAERCPTIRALLYSSIKVPGIRGAPPHIPGSPQAIISILSVTVLFMEIHKPLITL